jgi:ubiquinone/menaquinone biosynthesis C-methylase UbiE
MEEKRFDVKKLNKLNHPERSKIFPVEQIVKLAKLNKPQTIVDVGAGTGFFSIPFSTLFKNSKLYACDISEVMINWMNENIVTKYSNIIPLKMSDNYIPLENDTADFLFMVNLHHELNSPEKTLKDCFRVIKPKGVIAISDWKKENTNRGPSIHLRFTPEVIEEQLTEAGFHNIRVYNDFPNNFLLIGEK